MFICSVKELSTGEDGSTPMAADSDDNDYPMDDFLPNTDTDLDLLQSRNVCIVHCLIIVDVLQADELDNDVYSFQLATIINEAEDRMLDEQQKLLNVSCWLL